MSAKGSLEFCHLWSVTRFPKLFHQGDVRKSRIGNWTAVQLFAVIDM